MIIHVLACCRQRCCTTGRPASLLPKHGGKVPGIIGLNPGHLVGHQAVGGGVGFEECRWCLDKQPGYGRLWQLLAHTINTMGAFLGNTVAEEVSISKTAADKVSNYPHNLFLIHNNPAAFCQNGIQIGVREVGCGATMQHIDYLRQQRGYCVGASPPSGAR